MPFKAFRLSASVTCRNCISAPGLPVSAGSEVAGDDVAGEVVPGGASAEGADAVSEATAEGGVAARVFASTAGLGRTGGNKLFGFSTTDISSAAGSVGFETGSASAVVFGSGFCADEETAGRFDCGVAGAGAGAGPARLPCTWGGEGGGWVEG